MKIKFFTNVGKKCNDVEILLDELSSKLPAILIEKINNKTGKGKGIAKDWVIKSGTIPYLIFISNGEEHIYYMTNSDRILHDKNRLKGLTKDLLKQETTKIGKELNMEEI